MSPPKFKMGDWVYSWKNPGKKAKVTWIYRSPDVKEGYPHKYKLSVHDKDGYLKTLGVVNETGMTKRRTKAWLREHCPKHRSR